MHLALARAYPLSISRQEKQTIYSQYEYIVSTLWTYCFHASVNGSILIDQLLEATPFTEHVFSRKIVEIPDSQADCPQNILSKIPILPIFMSWKRADAYFDCLQSLPLIKMESLLFLRTYVCLQNFREMRKTRDWFPGIGKQICIPLYSAVFKQVSFEIKKDRYVEKSNNSRSFYRIDMGSPQRHYELLYQLAV